jgi:murein DD-endopeptidase MepM/ murein hydrolase activator NlpD
MPSEWRWPLPLAPELPDAPGRFGARRKYDFHTGVDLYCPPGTAVTAVEDGVVVAIELFTGEAAGSPWWNDTHAVLVKGATGIVVYGEITPLVSIGQTVKQGQELGVVKTVLKQDKGRPTTMLHIELMSSSADTTLWWPLGTAQPPDLLDPTPYLEALCKR